MRVKCSELASEGIVRHLDAWHSLRASASDLHLPGVDLACWPYGMYSTLVPDIDTARQLFDPGGMAARRARSEVYYAAGSMAARARLRIGMHDRGEEYMVADGRVHVNDLEGHARHFPMHLQVVRLRELHLAAGERIDIGVNPNYWPGLHHREELYTLLWVDHLHLAPGSALYWQGNVAILRFGQVDVAVGEQVASLEAYATPYPGFSQARRHAKSGKGKDGVPGADGQPGMAGSIMASPFGPILDKQQPGQAPGDGLPGTNADPGEDGANGGLQMLADIRISKGLRGAPASLRILAGGGAGEPGGDGGRGGDGGCGGQRATPEQAPGQSGAGGHGGAGGRGGSGGLSSNIFISLPPQDLPVLELCSLQAPGGSGGRAGSGGRGGPAGLDGEAGLPGRNRDGPPIWVFAEGQTPSCVLKHSFSGSKN